MIERFECPCCEVPYLANVDRRYGETVQTGPGASFTPILIFTATHVERNVELDICATCGEPCCPRCTRIAGEGLIACTRCTNYSTCTHDE